MSANSKTPVPLSELLSRVPSAIRTGTDDIAVTGITHDSRECAPGSVFVCLKGAKHDGHLFAATAVSLGAAVVVVEKNGLAAAGVAAPEGACIVTVDDTRSALPLLACAFHRDPSQSMTMVGVTGTNGKTTTTFMTASILRAAGLCVGTIGTLGADIDGRPLPSEHTTPEADHLQSLLAQMRDAGCGAVVMEVSSHALAQRRTDGIAFSAGIFTNLTQDHLDYHQTMDAYFEAKARLFAEYPILYPRASGVPFCSIINVGQWEGRDMVTRARGRVITFAATTAPAVLTAADVTLTADSAAFTAVFDPGTSRSELSIRLPIGGAFQVANALGAIGAGLALGVPAQTVIDGLSNMPPVPGRFESVPADGLGFGVIVDYAHSPDGLDNLLKSARRLNPARVVCVFGCGGDRDRGKRPIMGRIAASQAETVVVTSDNPRTEEPAFIISQIVEGIDSMSADERVGELVVEPDRRKAIHTALGLARPGDLVLIAGKGHEDYQIIGADVLEFDDRKVASEAMAGMRKAQG